MRPDDEKVVFSVNKRQLKTAGIAAAVGVLGLFIGSVCTECRDSESPNVPNTHIENPIRPSYPQVNPPAQLSPPGGLSEPGRVSQPGNTSAPGTTR